MEKPAFLSRRTRRLLVLSISFGPFIGGAAFLLVGGLTSPEIRHAGGYLGGPLLMFHPVILVLAYAFGLLPAAFSAVMSGVITEGTSYPGSKVFGPLLAGAISTLVFPYTLAVAAILVRGTAGFVEMMAAGALAALICSVLADRPKCPQRQNDGYSVRI